MNLVWFRHGETGANRERRYCGWSNPLLNRKGREQAEQAAEVLSTLPVHKVWTSDLLRCRQTAEPLLSRLSGVDLEQTPLLRELSFGEWEGCTYEAIQSRDPERLQRWLTDPHHVSPPGGETMTEMEFRLQKWLDSITEGCAAGELAVAVSHGGPIRWFISNNLKRDPGTFWERPVPHGSMVAAKWDRGEWREVPVAGLKGGGHGC